MNSLNNKIYDYIHRDWKDAFICGDLLSSKEKVVFKRSDLDSDDSFRKNILLYLGWCLGCLEYINSDYCCGPEDNRDENNERDLILEFIRNELFINRGLDLRRVTWKLLGVI